jgi:hypothetical protein
VTQCKRVRLRGSFLVALPPQDAFVLFTPAGERAWVDGWDPQFPGEVTDDSAPGTVFQTDHGGRRTTWIVARCSPGRAIEYAQVAMGDRAGLVSVACEPASDGMTTVSVSYDLTALEPEANVDLDAFAANYPGFLDHWSRSIHHTIDGRGGQKPSGVRSS